MTIKLIISLIAAAGAVALVALPSRAQTADRAAVIVGAERDYAWKPLLEGKKVGLLSNHTGYIDSTTHTLDALLDKGIDVKIIMSPEHGFRGTADAGEAVANGTDRKSGLPIASLYGRGKRRALTDAVGKVDVVVVDMQDVGARFYTYHITMIEVMEEAARQGKKVVVFDRPNPLGMVIDGPMLDNDCRSGVGRIPVPAVHGLTMGEIALMTNEEGWLKEGLKCDLTVVECDNYTHATRYSLPVNPSPNLKSMGAIYLYPSLCLFEGTPVSVGRGTEWPFQVFGHPDMNGYLFMFTPRSMAGATNPPQMGKQCYGMDLRGIDYETAIKNGMNLEYVIDAYKSLNLGEAFFTPMFDLLAGTKKLKRQIIEGKSAAEIRRTWEGPLEEYKQLRKKYIIYPD